MRRDEGWRRSAGPRRSAAAQPGEATVSEADVGFRWTKTTKSLYSAAAVRDPGALRNDDRPMTIDRIRVMISSRCRDYVAADGSTFGLSGARSALRQQINAARLFDQQLFECWINEYEPSKHIHELRGAAIVRLARPFGRARCLAAPRQVPPQDRRCDPQGAGAVTTIEGGVSPHGDPR